MLYILLAVILMAMDQRGQYIPRMRSLAGSALEPVYHVVEWPARVIMGLRARVTSHRSLRESNALLNDRILELSGVLQRHEALVEENRRLRALLNASQGQQFSFRFAELIQVDLDPFSHQVVIDRGRLHGVEVGQAVIDGAGIMGQIEDVRRHFSQVRLISDPNHALPVQINRTGLRTVAYGTGESTRLSLPNVPFQADVRVGDLVVTSGLGDRFPAGFPVGQVTRVDRETGGTFAALDVAPSASLGRGREVLLVTGSGGQAASEEPEPRVSASQGAGEIENEYDETATGAEAMTAGEQPR
jgi:rod shape-determining protein MreC